MKLIESISCMRFQEKTYYKISPFYTVIMSQIYQTENDDKNMN